MDEINNTLESIPTAKLIETVETLANDMVKDIRFVYSATEDIVDGVPCNVYINTVYEKSFELNQIAIELRRRKEKIGRMPDRTARCSSD